MAESFEAALREGLQWALLLLVASGFLGRTLGAGPKRALYLGALTLGLLGLSVGFLPVSLGQAMGPERAALVMRFADPALMYLGLLWLLLGDRLPREGSRVRALLGPLAFLWAAQLIMLDALPLGFYVHDTGVMKQEVGGAIAMAGAGLLIGLMPLPLLGGQAARLPLERAMGPGALLIFIGAYRVAVGGLGELDETNALVSLQHGAGLFNSGLVGRLRHLMMLEPGGFVQTPLAWWFDYLGGDRVAMALTILFVTAPPVYALLSVFSRPDPDVDSVDVAARRRLQLAFFRREMAMRALAPILSLFIILIAMHALSAAANPMIEPQPLPLREDEAHPGLLRIDVTGEAGDLSDQTLRKYLYYYGDRQVLFLAIMKPDGTIGVALDECEICKPAEWNKAAQGYAQKADTLVCKYCMTPIPITAVNEPGGCNPIPVPFQLEGGAIVIRLDDLVRLYNEAKSMQKGGTHL